MEGLDLHGLTLLHLLQLLVQVALELQGRVQAMVGARPEARGRDEEIGGRGAHPVPQRQVAACEGGCCICNAPCIRLEPGHKHCKCRRHLHYR